MYKYEYDALRHMPKDPIHSSSEFDSGTLIYGYDRDQNTWHVFNVDGLIHRFVYDYNGKVVRYEAKKSWDLRHLIPNKGVYWNASNYNFCHLCLNCDIHIPFTET